MTSTNSPPISSDSSLDHDRNPFDDGSAPSTPPLPCPAAASTSAFSDTPAGERETIVEGTLAVGENGNASLTMSADGVIILDMGPREPPRFDCFGLIPQRSTATRSIPYYNILSVEASKSQITIAYARPRSSKSAQCPPAGPARPKGKRSPLSVVRLSYPVFSSPELTAKWASRLLDRAFGPAQRRKRIKVLINPYGGAGKASKLYHRDVAPIFEAAGCTVDVEQTAYQGHAKEIASRLDINAYDVLACASGDGLPMESFNGLAAKPNALEALRKVAVAQIPCGTGNAMSWNLSGTDETSVAALCIVKGVRTPLDLVSITQADEVSGKVSRTLSFLSQSIGIVAESDLGTDDIRWMGDFRFTYGFLVRLLGKTVYPVDIAVKTEIEDKIDIKRHYARETAKRKRLDQQSYEVLDIELEEQTGLGLPPLRYGTINDPLPSKARVGATTGGVGDVAGINETESQSGWTSLEPYPNLGNFYCGNMCWMAADAPFFPASMPNDGMLDLVTIDGDIGRLKAISLLLAVENGTFFDQDVVRARKVSGVRIVPKFGPQRSSVSSMKTSPTSTNTNTPTPSTSTVNTATTNRSVGKKSLFSIFSARSKRVDGSDEENTKKGYFSVDGESMPFEPFQIEIHRGLGTVLSRQYGVYEYEGPKGWEDLSV